MSLDHDFCTYDDAPNRPLVADRLAEYYSPEEVLVWLRSPHPQLEGETPQSLMNSSAGLERVHAILDRLDADN
ncbi:MAG: DUF2384 domain-containing protein [Roseibium sp.]|nr:DUF2384 domain-containing protein [Roseibium sp.]